MLSIIEYRNLRSIFYYLGHDKNLFGTTLFKRMQKISERTWPQRQEKFKDFNDLQYENRAREV